MILQSPRRQRFHIYLPEVGMKEIKAEELTLKAVAMWKDQWLLLRKDLFS